MFEEAIPLHEALKTLYESLTKALESDPPPEIRAYLWHLARETLKQWIMKEYTLEKSKNSSAKLTTDSITGSRLSHIPRFESLIHIFAAIDLVCLI
jgi:hypothetical protein